MSIRFKSKGTLNFVIAFALKFYLSFSWRKLGLAFSQRILCCCCCCRCFFFFSLLLLLLLLVLGNLSRFLNGACCKLISVPFQFSKLKRQPDLPLPFPPSVPGQGSSILFADRRNLNEDFIARLCQRATGNRQQAEGQLHIMGQFLI